MYPYYNEPFFRIIWVFYLIKVSFYNEHLIIANLFLFSKGYVITRVYCITTKQTLIIRDYKANMEHQIMVLSLEHKVVHPYCSIIWSLKRTQQTKLSVSEIMRNSWKTKLSYFHQNTEWSIHIRDYQTYLEHQIRTIIRTQKSLFISVFIEAVQLGPSDTHLFKFIIEAVWYTPFKVFVEAAQWTVNQ